MKLLRFVLALLFSLSLTFSGPNGGGKSGDERGGSGAVLSEAWAAPAGTNQLAIGPSMALYKNSASGQQGVIDSLDMLAENGMNLVGWSVEWKNLEPSPGVFTLQEQLTNPLSIIGFRYPGFKGVVVILKMLDTFIRQMPADLASKPFDDPEVLTRWDGLIDAIAAQPSTQRITHILLGNEVDPYLSQHPEEILPFKAFYERGVTRIHQKMPGVKVSTIFTFSAASSPDMFQQLSQFSDFIAYSYYPVRAIFPAPWQMLSMPDVTTQLTYMGELAGNKPFAFTEIGASVSPANASSEDLQAIFVREMFKALDPYRRSGQLSFLLYNGQYDYGPGVCEAYAASQGVPATAICDFMNAIGLRSYETGAARFGWQVFSEGARRWITGADLPESWSKKTP